jgi:hypothetical protein
VIPQAYIYAGVSEFPFFSEWESLNLDLRDCSRGLANRISLCSFGLLGLRVLTAA